MLENLNNTVKEITSLSLEIEEIKNGAVVDPKTGNIVKDDNGETVYYKSTYHKSKPYDNPE